MTSIQRRVAARKSGQSAVAAAVEVPVQTPLLRFASILVPVDFSDPSRGAYEYALQLAEKFDSRVCLLTVMEDRTSHDLESFPLIHQKGAAAGVTKRKLVEFAKSGSHPFVPVSPEVRSGEPWQEIVDTAQKTGADLIVISTHGRTGLKHVLMGSVAEKVVRHAPCPVLVLRESHVELLVTRQNNSKKARP